MEVVFWGSTGNVPMGEPVEIEEKFTGIQPVPSTFLYVEVDLQEYV